MRTLLALLLVAIAAIGRAAVPASVDLLVKVGREGEGNEAASAAWRDVVKSGPAVLPAVLASMGKGSAVADNWLRLAGDTIVSSSKSGMPLAEVESFLKDTRNHAAGRLLAFDLLRQADAKRAEALEPALAEDPVQELRRGAVEGRIRAARSKTGADAKAAWRSALDVVRDEDQTKIIYAALKNLGEQVNLPRHFGFLMKWNVIGPFDNTGGKGFDAVFPPEKTIDAGATYDGKGGPVKWQPFESRDDYGKLDFNKPFGMLKGATAYAATTFDSPEDRDAELRLGCKNGWKVWLNGELLFSRDEYHRGQQMDQYKMKCRLKKGSNVILVKCCQDEQKEEWTVEWEFQLRVCDSAGTAISDAK